MSAVVPCVFSSSLVPIAQLLQSGILLLVAVRDTHFSRIFGVKDEALCIPQISRVVFVPR